MAQFGHTVNCVVKKLTKINMKFAVCFAFATLAAFVMLTDAYPQGSINGLTSLGNTDGMILLHTSGIEKGHQHTASCFGFGQGGGPPPPTTAATTTTTAASG